MAYARRRTGRYRARTGSRAAYRNASRRVRRYAPRTRRANSASRGGSQTVRLVIQHEPGGVASTPIGLKPAAAPYKSRF